MPIKNRCDHCGAVRNAYEFRKDIPYKVKLIVVYDSIHKQPLTLCETCNKAWVVEKRTDEAIQLKLF